MVRCAWIHNPVSENLLTIKTLIASVCGQQFQQFRPLFLVGSRKVVCVWLNTRVFPIACYSYTCGIDLNAAASSMSSDVTTFSFILSLSVLFWTITPPFWITNNQETFRRLVSYSLTVPTRPGSLLRVNCRAFWSGLCHKSNYIVDFIFASCNITVSLFLNDHGINPI